MNVLISIDGLSYKIFERYSQQFTSNGFSYIKKIITTFPSVTFNAHATAITGNNHHKHSVFDNILSRSKTIERIPLYDDHEIICNETLHRQTLFHSLSMNNLKSSSIHWPLTSGNPYINHLVTESSSKKKIQKSESVYEIDRIALHETMQSIESNSYHFIATRFIGYDALSHKYGKDSLEATEHVQILFEYVNQIFNMLEKSRKSYNLLVFSDHGQSDVETFFYPNEVLAQTRWKKHLIEQEIRFITDGSGSLLFYSLLGRQQNREIMDYFNDLNEVNHFYEVEAESNSQFKPVGILDLKHTVCGEDIFTPEEPKYKELKSLHGYHPNAVDEMNGFMICIGDQIKKGKIIEQGRIENIAPTLANLSKIQHDCNGEEINDIIREFE